MMPRIRTTKPEFWTSEQVLLCSRDARLLFIGLWNFCDDAGIIPASSFSLKAKVFPSDNLNEDNIRGWIDELIQNELLREYAVKNKAYWQVTGWHDHQRITKPNYRYPRPDEHDIISKKSDNIPQPFHNQSTTIHEPVTDYSVTDQQPLPSGKEWKGKEGKGKYICKVSGETSPVSYSTTVNNQHTDNGIEKIKTVFEYWQQIMSHPRAKLDEKRKRAIKKALENYSVDELKQAIDGCKNTAFNMGNNTQQQKYDDIMLILRDSTHIERFINHASQSPISSPSLQTDYDELTQGAI